MDENRDGENQKYERLYNQYKQLNIKLDNTGNPIGRSVVGGAVIACTLMIGNTTFDISIPAWAIVSSFFVGEAAVSLPLLKTTYKISKTEDKMLEIADKYSHVVNYPEGYYDLDSDQYFSNREAYLEFYHDQIQKEDKGPVKKLRKSN